MRRFAPLTQPAGTVSWRRIAVPTYGPTILISSGQGATLPLVVSGRGIGTAYGFAAVMSLSAALLTAFLPDVTRTQRAAWAGTGQAHASVLSVLRLHRRTLLTLGTGVLAISAAARPGRRSSRCGRRRRA